ncbi:protein translocase subunit SecDF [Dyadobacter fanqingshengii]|uniref:Multifunctional fusion protein n=1 Tax=Dyadobacter fanqingshengii TaxID=2906443 RepID=A0A9X1PCD3_9BACT|nr:protein translocase subunit SecDF [Dyadobacter fanqingshengii]MCF0042371.1 protein translocase subunit SecDF [Dyadobacter fanqingshengii]USJ35103.1 protein translocase subunit SecDF [Dyadobacter fanqingshengii]
MANKNGIIGLTIVIALISVYYLSFTFVSRNIKAKSVAYATDAKGEVDLAKKQRYVDSLWREDVYLGHTLQEVTERELNLGLDLQGGMHVVMEVAPADILKGMAGGNARSVAFQNALKKAGEDKTASNSAFINRFAAAYKEAAPNSSLAALFATSSNRGKISSSSSDGDVVKMLNTEVNGSIDRAFQITQARIDKFGVTNPNIQRLPGQNRILVELPGVDNPERVRRLLSGAAKLEFSEVYLTNELAAGLDGLGKYLAKQEEIKKATGKPTTAAAATTDTTKKTDGGLAAQLAQKSADSTATDSSAIAAQSAALTNLFVPMPQGLGVFLKDTARASEILRRPEVKSLFPADLVFMWDRKGTEGVNNQLILPLYFIKKANGVAAMEGDVIVDATHDYDERGRPEVTMRMNGEGARKWRTLTARSVGRPVAIIIDNLVYTAPTVQGEIPNGNSSITGSFTVEETKDMSNVLKAGKLPAPTHIVEEAVVGSSLGAEAINDGLISSAVGLLIVLVFMVAYYSRAGWIADMALLINLFFLLGVMASLGAVLTLSGIAGIVLSIGMAVDANVLIYEGIKVELEGGKPFAQAVRDGFKHSLTAIIDSNVTTLLTGIILYTFGTGLVLGFATTLVLGLLTSLFCAIFITRLFLEQQIKRGKVFNFYSGLTKNWFKDNDFDFVSQRRRFYIISTVIMAIGIGSFIFKGFGLGIDFKGGRSYVVRFQESVDADKLRSIMDEDLGSTTEVKTFGGQDQVKITTAYLIEETSTDADQKAESKILAGVKKIPNNPAKIVSSNKVGPTMANDTLWSAVYAILLALAANFVYIFIRFKRVAFSYGAVVSLAHDVIIILAIFSLFNGWLPWSLDIDQAFIGAILTMIGYSMNDTVVIYDRIRDYLKDDKARGQSLPTVINNALNSTLSRTAVTGISVILVLIVLMIFGGAVIRGFTFCMLLGVIVGTYSSLFVAAPIVVDLLQREKRKEPALTVAETVAPVGGKKIKA